jgi:hypothetical protein
LIEVFLARTEDENTRVKDVWPANIGNGRELVRQSEKVRKRPHGKHIGVKKYDF